MLPSPPQSHPRSPRVEEKEAPESKQDIAMSRPAQVEDGVCSGGTSDMSLGPSNATSAASTISIAGAGKIALSSAKVISATQTSVKTVQPVRVTRSEAISLQQSQHQPEAKANAVDESSLHPGHSRATPNPASEEKAAHKHSPSCSSTDSTTTSSSSTTMQKAFLPSQTTAGRNDSQPQSVPSPSTDELKFETTAPLRIHSKTPSASSSKKLLEGFTQSKKIGGEMPFNKVWSDLAVALKE